MNQETLQELFSEQLRDIYHAEKQLVKALPKLAKAAESAELAEALRNHLEETQKHVERLEQVFESLGVAAKGKPCKGMMGLIEEGNEAVQEKEKGILRDLAIIAGCQKVEHYEMSGYGTLRTLAEQLGNDTAVELLQETEEEEKAADQKLTEVAAALYESVGDETDDKEGEEKVSAASSTQSPATLHRKSAR